MNAVFRWCCGRSTFFALVLLVSGIVLAAFHRLDAAFVGLATVIQGMITARAVSDDHKEKRANWHAEEEHGHRGAVTPR